jgi:beta-lactamase regulating signal transducer with metallopeptidase domain
MSILSPAWIIETLLASTLLTAAVLVLRRPAARLLGPHAAYMLWAVPALRLLLPPIPGAPALSVPLIQAPAFATQAAQGLPGSGGGAVEMAPTLHPAAGFAPSFDWGLALLGLWLAGGAIHMAWHFVRYRRFIRGAVGARAPEHVVDGIGVHSADVAGPAAAGIVRRRILLPYDFADRFDSRERRLALAHEVAHHRRGDLVANWFALAALSLHWFNPLAHIAYRAFRADQELACDATVLGEASEVERHAYASAVVKAAWARSPVAACPMNSAGQLKARLTMMKAGAGGRRRRLAGLAVVCVVATAALGATASRTAVDLPQAAPARAAPAVLDWPASASVEPVTVATVAPAEVMAPDAAAIAPTSLDAAGAPTAGSRDPRREVAASTPLAAAVEERPAPLMVGYADGPAEGALPPPVLVQAVTPPANDDKPADRQPVSLASPPPAALPPAEVLKASATAASKELVTLPKGVLAVGNVRAVLVDGRFNAADPGASFAGFCGEVLLSGETRPRAFFVSTTPSTPGRAAKCAGPRSVEDYSSYFRPPARATTARAPRRAGCGADQSSCSTPFSRLVRYDYLTEPGMMVR